MFDTAEQAREYILTHDHRAKELNRQSVTALRRIYGQSLAAQGIQVLAGGPAVMSKDELINAICDQEYPRIAAALAAYYASIEA